MDDHGEKTSEKTSAKKLTGGARPELKFGTVWQYEPAPESTDHFAIAQRHELFVGGVWKKPKSGEYFATIDPATERVLSEVAMAGEKDVDAAVAAARQAFPAWSRLSGEDRSRYLFRIARILLERAREFACLETLDNVKPIRETRDVDTPLP